MMHANQVGVISSRMRQRTPRKKGINPNNEAALLSKAKISVSEGRLTPKRRATVNFPTKLRNKSRSNGDREHVLAGIGRWNFSCISALLKLSTARICTLVFPSFILVKVNSRHKINHASEICIPGPCLELNITRVIAVANARC